MTVVVTNLRSGEGLVRACLTAETRKFHKCEGPSVRTATVPAGKRVLLTFRDIAPGRYAIALLHDENANDRADMTLGIPREGFGFSRNVQVRTGPPRFGSAAFDVGNTPVRQTIAMQYLF